MEENTTYLFSVSNLDDEVETARLNFWCGRGNLAACLSWLSARAHRLMEQAPTAELRLKHRCVAMAMAWPRARAILRGV